MINCCKLNIRSTGTLLSIPLYHSNRVFVSLNISEETPRYRRSEEMALFQSTVRDTGKSALKIYQDWIDPKNWKIFQYSRCIKHINESMKAEKN